MPAISKDMMGLIDAIADADMPRAKAYARVVIANDTDAKSRAWWRERVKAKLEATATESLADVPRDLEGMVVVEDSTTFPVGRFTLLPGHSEVVYHVRRMRKACGRLAEMSIPYANATMLWGESGTGKTTLARYVAYEQELPFVYVSFARLVDSYMGATSRNVARVFDWCSQFPCLLMLDEIDTIAATRSAAHDGAAKELGRVTVTLMQQLDRLSPSMLLLAATNRPDIIDPALARRFTRSFEVARPENPDDVHCIVENYLDDCGLCYDVELMERIMAAWQGPCPTQAEVVNALVESIAEHELAGMGREEPVDVGFLARITYGGSESEQCGKYQCEREDV